MGRARLKSIGGVFRFASCWTAPASATPRRPPSGSYQGSRGLTLRAIQPPTLSRTLPSLAGAAQPRQSSSATHPRAPPPQSSPPGRSSPAWDAQAETSKVDHPVKKFLCLQLDSIVQNTNGRVLPSFATAVRARPQARLRFVCLSPSVAVAFCCFCLSAFASFSFFVLDSCLHVRRVLRSSPSVANQFLVLEPHRRDSECCGRHTSKWKQYKLG